MQGRSSGRARRALAAAALSLAGVFALTGVASAASISYTGSDNNVWLASPDGKLKHRVTTTGTADVPFRSPTQKNDGTIVAIQRAGAGSSTAFAHFLRPTDGKITNSWILPKTGSGSFVPFTGGQISPDGGMFVYDWRFFDCPIGGCVGGQRISFIAGPGTTNPCLINCHSGYIKPRWIPGTPYAGAVSDNLQTIAVQKQGAAGPVAWLVANDPGSELISSFDVGPTGRTLVETTAPGDGPSNLIVVQNNGTPPDGAPQVLCATTNYAPDNSNPRWSPDGSMISWTGANGVNVSPAPTTDGGVCGLSPRLVGPGGKDGSWGRANIPATAGKKGKKCKKPKKKGKKGAAAAKKKKGCKRKKGKRKKK